MLVKSDVSHWKGKPRLAWNCRVCLSYFLQLENCSPARRIWRKEWLLSEVPFPAKLPVKGIGDPTTVNRKCGDEDGEGSAEFVHLTCSRTQGLSNIVRCHGELGVTMGPARVGTS